MSLQGRKVHYQRLPPGLEIRFTQPEDCSHWGKWLAEPEVRQYYPSRTEQEVAQSIKMVENYTKYRASLTAVYEGEVAGIAYLNLHPYRKIAHHCIFTIIVGGGFRGHGIGRVLLEHLEKLARDSFRLEGLHLEVYSGNPAIRLYRRMGYTEFGVQTHWGYEGEGQYRGKIYMEKWFK